jgi:translation initiation factor 2 alpha subunit (eIF-2alpha)
LAGEACSTKDVQIKIRLVAPPQYVMTTTSTDKVAAIDVMEKAVEKIGEVITEEKGDMTVKMAVSRFTGLMRSFADNHSQRSFPRRMMPSSRL